MLIATAALATVPFPLAHAAGVTIITHGFNSDAQGWVLGMGSRIPTHPDFPGTNVICYEARVTDNGSISVASRKLAGGDPLSDPNAEIVIKLDWGDLAGFFAQYDTYEVAAAIVPRLLQTNFIAELRGHALAELPLHLVGHSRGGSLVCQMSRLLGTNGVWVDHLTTLDPHPVNEDGNSDPLGVSDAPLRVYENVLFADNYYQDFGGYPHGQRMANSYNRRLTTLPGGYSSAHSDTHLWYHATIDLSNPADDTEAQLSASNRATWFNVYEDGGRRAGFHYSRLVGGNRLSLDMPAGPGTDTIARGYNQRWDLGAGASGNRTALPRNLGHWPNLIQLALAGTNALFPGGSNAVTFAYQWAQPQNRTATIGLFLDPDTNPFNANSSLVTELVVSGTTSNLVGTGVASFYVPSTNSAPGTYSIFARITADGRARHLYAPGTLTVWPAIGPPRLAIRRQAASAVLVEVSSVAGLRVELQGSEDLKAWRPLATNQMQTAIWTYSDEVLSGGQRFYRAVAQ